MEKLTYEFVKEQFEREGYELLSEEYLNQGQKLEYICPKGHRHSITYVNWYSGHRCPYCDGQGKPSISFISNEFKKEGYILLDDHYENCYGKLNYICDNGHKHAITWNNWQQGKRCPYCANRPPIIVEFIRTSFIAEGYILLTTKYINNRQKLDYICPEGHRGSITWDNWNSAGNRCPICYYLSISGKDHYNWKGGISCEPYCDAWADK